MTTDWNNTLIIAEANGTNAFTHSIEWTESVPTVRTTPDESSALRVDDRDADALVDRLNTSLWSWDSERTFYGTRTAVCPGITAFRGIGTLRPWLATWRDAPRMTGRRVSRAGKPKTLGPFFARSYPAARRYARDVLDREHDGAELLEVTQTTDPRS